MPGAEDLESFNRMRQTGTDVNAQQIPKMPPLPDSVKKRFPELEKWERDVEEWRVSLTMAVRGGPV